MVGWEAIHKQYKNGSANPRTCDVCKSEFIPFSGSHRFCSIICKGKWKYITGVYSTENQYKYISGNWRRYFNRLICRSQKREDLTVDDLLELYDKQEGYCALSGVQLTCKLEKGKKNSTNASIDRIDAGGPYNKGNIHLVCSALNSFRNDTNLEEFIDWCCKVADKSRGLEVSSYAKKAA